MHFQEVKNTHKNQCLTDRDKAGHFNIYIYCIQILIYFFLFFIFLGVFFALLFVSLFLCYKSNWSWSDGLSDHSFMVDPLSSFLFHPVFHDWCNKGCGMCYPVCGMVHIKVPLLLIGNSNNPCNCCSGFPLSLSERLVTKKCVECIVK